MEFFDNMLFQHLLFTSLNLHHTKVFILGTSDQLIKKLWFLSACQKKTSFIFFDILHF